MINFIALVEILQLNNDISDDSMCFKKIKQTQNKDDN